MVPSDQYVVLSLRLPFGLLFCLSVICFKDIMKYIQQMLNIQQSLPPRRECMHHEGFDDTPLFYTGRSNRGENDDVHSVFSRRPCLLLLWCYHLFIIHDARVALIDFLLWLSVTCAFCRWAAMLLRASVVSSDRAAYTSPLGPFGVMVMEG